MKRRLLVALVGASVVLAAACSSTPTGGPGQPVRPDVPDALDGRAYVSTAVLVEGHERPLVPGTRIELSFEGGRLSARAGCNLIGARYRLEGDVLRIVGAMGTTEMGCDPERHEQDAWLSTFLGSSPRVRLGTDRLTLVSGGTEIRLLDREVAEPDLPLEGTAWVLETLVKGPVASSVPTGLRATLRIEGGRIAGFNGCNEWGGRVVGVDGGVLRVRAVGQTAKLCTGAAAQLEDAVMTVVSAPRIAYEIDGPRLILRARGRELHFRGETD